MLLASSWGRSILPFFAGLALASAGCGAGDDGADGPLGEADQPSVCAKGTTVKGVDVSVYQGSIQWSSVKAAGIDFAIARISDGASLDSAFDGNWSAMKHAGLVRGAYQFFEPADDPAALAEVVIHAVGALGPGDLPVTADVEVTGGEAPATIAKNLQAWIDRVREGTGKTPMIYTALGFWNASVASKAFGDDALWAANWGVTCPSLAEGWSDWRIWQYSDTGSVHGIPATVDLDVFNGDLEALEKLAGETAVQDAGTAHDGGIAVDAGAAHDGGAHGSAHTDVPGSCSYPAAGSGRGAGSTGATWLLAAGVAAGAARRRRRGGGLGHGG